MGLILRVYAVLVLMRMVNKKMNGTFMPTVKMLVDNWPTIAH